jgi:hypothetical protein
VYCPHCRAELLIDPQVAGDVVSCPQCNGRFQSPIPQAPAAYPPGGSFGGQLHPGVKICVLISGIWNLLAGLAWIATLCAAFIGIPQVILGVFELVFVAQVDRMSLQNARSQSQVLAVFQIISGLFNFVSLVCGILILVFANTRQPD